MRSLPLTTLIALSTSISLSGIERHIPAKQPQEKGFAQDQNQTNPNALPAEAPVQAPREQKAFLGVFGNPVSDAMAAQLGLADDIGLALEYISPESPAGIAGLKTHDIITQLDGEDITTQNDLRKVVQSKKPNDKIKINYISGGKAQHRIIELKTSPNKNLAAVPGRNQHEMPKQQQPLPKKNNRLQVPRKIIPKELLQNLPPKQREKLEQFLKGNLNNLNLRNLKDLNLNQLDQHFHGMNHRLNLDDMLRNNIQGVQQNSRMKMVDGDGSITIIKNGRETTIELHDQEGKLLYNGPYNNDADKLKIPGNLRDRANKIKVNQHPNQNGNHRGLGNLHDPFRGKLADLFNDPFFNQGAFPLQQGIFPQGLKQRQVKPGQRARLKGKMMNQAKFRTVDPETGLHYSTQKNNGAIEIEIHSPDGELLYSGPYNNAADRALVPEDFNGALNKVDQLLKR